MKNKKHQEQKQRHIEFLRLFATVPADSNVARIRWVAEKLDRAENTVRIYLMKTPTRVPPKLALRVLADEIAKAKKSK